MTDVANKSPQPWRPKDWEHRQEIVKSHCAQLGEHFDSVQIICTSRTTEGRTSMNFYGQGNAYACEGSVREWLKVQDERMRENIRHEDDD